MERKRRAPKGKEINPTFFVFCEGETEVAYVNFLKRHFRLPSIQIHSRVSRNNITAGYIENYKADKPQHEKDIDFLMYDLDAPAVFERLKGISDAILLVSNPCIELWFLLHYKNQKATCESSFCMRELKNRNKNHRKGELNQKLKDKLRDKMKYAVKNAKALTDYENPSSTVYLLVEALMVLKK